MRGLQALAERVARARCAVVLARIAAAVVAHAPGARVERSEEAVRAHGRGLRRRWLSEPGLRFARRIRR
jgi:hypothetical protein